MGIPRLLPLEPTRAMKNMQTIDRSSNANNPIWQVTDEEFRLIFPRRGQDLEIIEAVRKRLGRARSELLFAPIWNRPVYKPDVQGIHGTLFYDYHEFRNALPASKREIDRDERGINQAERELYRRIRTNGRQEKAVREEA
jgi:hypothetical protein